MSVPNYNNQAPPPPYICTPPPHTPPPPMQAYMQPGGCRCGGFVTMENDTTCLIIVIVLSIVCFPCGLFGLLCLEKKPVCRKCGAPGLVYAQQHI